MNKLLLIALLLLSLGCEDKVSEPSTEIVDRPTACPSTDPELERSAFTFEGILDVTDVKRTSAVVSWQASNNFNQYHIISLASSGRSIIATAGTNDNEVALSGLTPDSEYTLMVRAIDTRGFLETNTKKLTFKTLPWPNFSNIKSLRLNGAQSVLLPASNQFNLSSNFSFAGWFKKADEAKDERVFTFHRGVKASSALSLGLKKDKLYLTYREENGQTRVFSHNYDYHDNRWHQFVFTYDQSFLKLYVDGALVFTIKDKLEGITGKFRAHIGAYAGTQKAFTGSIDEFSFFQQALNLAEVEELYLNAKAYDLRDHSQAASLLSWYRFGDGSLDDENRIEDVISGKNAFPLNINPTDFSNDSP